MAKMLAMLTLVGVAAAATVPQSPYALGWKRSPAAVRPTQMVDITIVVQVKGY